MEFGQTTNQARVIREEGRVFMQVRVETILRSDGQLSIFMSRALRALADIEHEIYELPTEEILKREAQLKELSGTLKITPTEPIA